MAAETVVIDVIANFKDQMSPGIDNAKTKADKFGKEIDKTAKQVQKLSKDKTTVKLDAEDKASKKIESAKKQANSFSNTKAKATLNADDKATTKIQKVKGVLKGLVGKVHNTAVDVRDNATQKITNIAGKAKDFASTIYKATIGAEDNTSGPLRTIMGGIKGFAGKTFSATLSIVDKVTSPIRGIMNSIFSLKTLVAGLIGGAAANQLIAAPIGIADQQETAFIGFETMFKSASKAQNMMNEIQQFAASTPFDTSGVVSSVQQMIRAGWSVDEVMGDMEKIGNAAAAAGQGTEGVQGIVLALQQMRMSGKLNAQDMMQLTNRGVKGWEYVAEAIGKTIPETRELASKGLIPVETALDAIIDGMGEYDGMMQKMSNRTVSGIMSNLKDTFEIKIISKWGKGLAEGATNGLGKIADYLDKIDPMLQKAGTSLQDLGQELSTGFFDIIEKGYNKLADVISSDEFKNAEGIVPKVKVAWDKLISEPFGEWWDSTGYPWIVDKMTSAGEGLGSGLSNIFKGLLGFNSGDLVDDAATIGGGFAKGFLRGFDGSGVLDALKESIKNAFSDALKAISGNGDGSSWLSAALLGYGGLKIGGGLVHGYNTIAGIFGKQTLGKALIGSVGMQQIGTSVTGEALHGLTGSGLLGLLGKTGYGLGSAAASGTGLALAGASGIAGGIAGGVSVYQGAKNVYRALNADTSTDLGKKEREAYGKAGAKQIGGVAAGAAAGAAIGSFIPVIGTAVGALIGAGIGGIAGGKMGKSDIEGYNDAVAEAEEKTRELKISQEQAKYSSQSMKDAVRDLAEGTITATEFQEQFNKAVSENKKDHFGNIKLSLSEISDMANKIVFDKAIEGLEKFSSASSDAETSLSNLKSASSTMEKWVWKGSLGLKLTDDDKASYKESVDNYISSAKEYVENKHYEFTAAVNVLLDTEAAEGITSSADAMYQKIQEDLNAAGEDLTAKVNVALEDGVITADEQKIISEAQKKMQEITEKISNAETEAEFQTLKIKYGGGDLDAESFERLQSELASTVDEAMASYDESLKVGISGLQLELNEGAISQEEYNKQLKALTDGYNAKVDELEVRVEGFQFEALTDSYGEELDKALAESDFAGTTQEKITQAMQSALKDGVDVANWDAETASKYLGLDSLEQESAQAITDITAKIAQTIPEKLTEAISTGDSGEGMKFNGSGFVNSVKSGIDSALEEADFSDTVSKFNTQINSGFAASGLETSFDGSGFVNSVKTGVNSAVEEADFSDTGSGVATKLSDGVSTAINEAPMDNINSSINLLQGKTQTAVDDAFSKGFSTTTTVNVTADYKLANPTATLSFSGGGTGTATVKGSITGNATGDIVNGKQLSWLAEEGPEAVIPLIPKRRKRGLELWEKAGRALGVLNNATGGFVGGSESGSAGGSGLLHSAFSGVSGGSTSTESKGKTSSTPYQVNVGGVTISISTDSKSGDIIQQIQAKSKEITDMISEMVNDALTEAFEDMPLASTD